MCALFARTAHEWIGDTIIKIIKISAGGIAQNIHVEQSICRAKRTTLTSRVDNRAEELGTGMKNGINDVTNGVIGLTLSWNQLEYP